MRIAFLVLAFTICVLPAQSQQTASKSLPQPGPETVERFRLVTTTINEPGVPEEEMIFLLDTQTGKVWKYQPGLPPVKTLEGKVVSVGPSFNPVPVQ